MFHFISIVVLTKTDTFQLIYYNHKTVSEIGKIHF